MDKNNENLRELIEKFMDPQNVQMYLDDIEAGERILRQHPAPKPDDILLANIKANITLHKTPKQTVTFRKRVYEALAVAASIIIIASISLQSINEPPPNFPKETNYSSLLPDGFWTHDNEVISEFNNDINDINMQIVQVSMDTIDYGYDSSTYAQYDKELQQLENLLYNVGNTQEEYTYNNGIFEDIEDLENRFNEFNENFLQEDYSYSGDLEI
ncbi:MAG: hypothetical protein JXA96_13870 [Sedimentisphaerales bacterium]|nr:hypothetical protein [Sedimentisphaerales bacterium]